VNNDILEFLLNATKTYDDIGLALNFIPVNNKSTAHNVQAVFEGDEPCSATAYALTPNGTEYAVCTTFQYGYKPASNSTWLTVGPHRTDAVATPESGEQPKQKR
jgi:hypothetical protein